jgi:hypothetical protein
MICPFVGGPLDGERHELAKPPPHIRAAQPVSLAFTADPEPVMAEVPDYVTYVRWAFRSRAGGRLFAYFCGVDPGSVVPVVLGGQLYVTRPRDMRIAAANVLAELFKRQMFWWNLQALRDEFEGRWPE